MRAEEYREREATLAGWPVKIVSYKMGDTYYVKVQNVSPGAAIVRKEGKDLKAVEAEAIKAAEEHLSKTRRFPVGSSKTCAS